MALVLVPAPLTLPGASLDRLRSRPPRGYTSLNARSSVPGAFEAGAAGAAGSDGAGASKSSWKKLSFGLGFTSLQGL